ncbi:unnamed protein product [Penicillium salamii]|uniref:Acetylxylan esterase n=1 Tax=Penicillium salamii TaxID=1612424 RepID=A0A9W4J005_9EURO|nr:unnamed protein product [Penicillium salamii]
MQEFVQEYAASCPKTNIVVVGYSMVRGELNMSCPGVTPRMNSALCGPFSESLHSYCDYGDNQCCSPYPEDGNAAHHNYVHKYNQNVVDFIKLRLGAGWESHAHNNGNDK